MNLARGQVPASPGFTGFHRVSPGFTGIRSFLFCNSWGGNRALTTSDSTYQRNHVKQILAAYAY